MDLILFLLNGRSVNIDDDTASMVYFLRREIALEFMRQFLGFEPYVPGNQRLGIDHRTKKYRSFALAKLTRAW